MDFELACSFVCHIIFDNLAVRSMRIHGFASPGHPGFAFSEYAFSFNPIFCFQYNIGLIGGGTKLAFVYPSDSRPP